MKQYLDLVRHILDHGEKKQDRTGTGTISVFGYQCKYDLRQGFPLLTTKKVLFDALVYELLWFLRGSTNINDDLKAHTPIWNAWAKPSGELGPIYGYQWRSWEKFVLDEKSGHYRKEHIDQIQNALYLIKTNPDSRRIIVSAWNVADIDKMALNNTLKKRAGATPRIAPPSSLAARRVCQGAFAGRSATGAWPNGRGGCPGGARHRPGPWPRRPARSGPRASGRDAG